MSEFSHEYAGKEVCVVYLSNKTQVARELLVSLQIQESDPKMKARFKVFPVTSRARLVETLQKYKLDIAIIEEEFVDDEPASWLAAMNTAVLRGGFDKVPFVFVSSKDRKPAEVREVLSKGFKEMLVKPVDMAILLQTINRLVPSKNILRTPALYNMPTSVTISVGLPLVLETLSETEVSITSDTPYYPGDVVSLYAEAFSESGQHEVVGTCIHSCRPLGQERYKNLFSLQGVTPALSRSIRRWINLTCAKDKEKFTA